jgi:hypothetical protein
MNGYEPLELFWMPEFNDLKGTGKLRSCIGAQCCIATIKGLLLLEY